MNLFKLLPGIPIIAVILFIFYLFYLILRPFLLVLIIAFIFSIFLNNIYGKLLVRVRKPWLAAFLSIFLLMAVIIPPVIFIVGNVVHEAGILVDVLQKDPAKLKSIEDSVINQLSSYGIPVSNLGFSLQEEAVGILKTVGKNLATTLIYAGSVFLNTFFVILTLFFFLIQKNKIKNYLLEAKIIPKRHLITLLNRTVELVNGIVRGNLIVVALQTFIATIGFLIFGLPAPILFGLAYGLFSLLPGIGVLLVWAPIAGVIFFTLGPLTAILFAGWFVISNLLMDYLVAPKIIGDHTKLHQLFILFAVVGGVQQFGIIGIILGPVVVALAFVVLDIYKELVEEAQKIKS